MVDPAPRSECLLQVLSLVEKPVNLTFNGDSQLSGQVPYLQVTRWTPRKIKHFSISCCSRLCAVGFIANGSQRCTFYALSDGEKNTVQLQNNVCLSLCVCFFFFFFIVLCQDPPGYERLSLGGPSSVQKVQVTSDGKTSECYHLLYQQKAYTLILRQGRHDVQCKIVSVPPPHRQYIIWTVEDI